MKAKIKLPSLSAVLGLFFGAGLGILFAIQMTRFTPTGLTGFQELGMICLMLFLLYLALFLHIPIHEAGHLVFGLATGYRFVSFRILCFQLTHADGKLIFSRHSVAGTGGQCLMSPPDLVDSKIPFVLYNLGGSLMNVFTSILFFIFFYLGNRTGIFSFFCLSMVEVGLLIALTNGIPLEFSGIHNDGSNVLAAAKNPKALRAFWIQLKVNEELSKGKRLKDLPDEWFHLPSDEDMDNSLTEATATFACNRLIDQGYYAEAAKLITRLLSGERRITGMYAKFLACDQLCCELIGSNRPEVVSQLYTKELREFMKSMTTSPSIIRTQYIHALLSERDQKKASVHLEKFQKYAKNYPYSGDLMADRELIAFALQKAQSEATYNG